MEQAVVTAVTHDTSEAKVTVTGVPDKPGIAARLFRALADRAVNVDTIVQNTSLHGTTDISFTVPKVDLDTSLAVARALAPEIGAGEVTADDAIAKVSLVGAGMRSHPGVSATMFETLADAGINIEMISTSSIRISCVVRAERVEEAVRLCTRRSSCQSPEPGPSRIPSCESRSSAPPGRWARSCDRCWPSVPSRSTTSASSPRPARPARRLPWAGGEIDVEDAETADYRGVDIALMSAGAGASRTLSPRRSPRPVPSSSTTRRRGAWTPTSPSSSPRSTPHALDRIDQGHRRQSQLHDHGGHARAGAAAPPGRTAPPGDLHLPGRVGSGTGRGARARGATGQDGRRSRRASPSTAPPWTSPRRRSSPAPSPTTCWPWPARSSTTGRGRPTRSRSCATRAARSSAIPDLAVSGTCVRVPVFTGHSLSINAEFDRALTVETARAPAASRPPGCATSTCPRRSRPTGIDPVLVGRLRRDDTRRPRTGALRVGRQPAQGRRPQRRADRRGPAGPASA